MRTNNLRSKRWPFGYVHVPSAGDLPFGGALWSIDSDFDCREVAPGARYSMTDHCGQLAILVPDLNPRYVAQQVRWAGAEQGFSRDFRPSLQFVEKLRVQVPVTAAGDLDVDLMKAWADYAAAADNVAAELERTVAG